MLQRCLLLLALIFSPFSAIYAVTFALPAPGNNIVGEIQSLKIKPSENFHDIARKFDIGYDALISSNPGVNPDKRLFTRTIIIPTQFVLPPIINGGIVINIAEMHLYYFPSDGDKVMVFPIGIGQIGWSTPTGETRVAEKIEDPTWHVPPSISESLAEKGVYLPPKVTPGPQDPLGSFALRLALPGYLIHGTNNPNSIGTRSSSGCIRLYPEDIATLFNQINLHAPVILIDEAFKVGVSNGQVYLEVHEPLNEDLKNLAPNPSDNISPLIHQLLTSISRDTLVNINWTMVSSIVEQHNGIPQSIGFLSPNNQNNPTQIAQAQAPNPHEG